MENKETIRKQTLTACRHLGTVGTLPTDASIANFHDFVRKIP
jgi:hypothetical protein